MMRIAYFDCFSGISGDMCLGSLLCAGVDLEQLTNELQKLPIEGYRLRLEKVKLGGILACSLFVDMQEHIQPHRNLDDIENIIAQSALPEEVKEKSKAVFRRLARAEARVHDTTVERIHFHEVGAVDAIVDVVGTVAGLHMLGVERVFMSSLPMGKGFVHCRHGMMPLPAPATMEILSEGRIPVYGTGIEGELVTPTGAALGATLGDCFGEMPMMTVSRVGYGAGKQKLAHPNLLRLVLGEPVNI